ncbi:hypothetical protein VNI00_002371 [Paramarasmius palmivorus]|uniref:Uncharacterized protein n=1 Tax=Paramarasmius palmivorus TaxID=297713 RepID=A0AAW0DUK0_9AGAR
MLEGDASFRFFANFGSQALDNCVLDCAQDRWEFTYLDELLPMDDDLLDWTEAYFYLMELFGDPDGPLLDCEMTSIGSYAQGGSQPDWTQEYPYVLELFYGLPSDLGMNIARGLRFDTVYSASLAPIARWPLDNSRSWFCIEDIGKEGNEGRQGLVNRKLVGDGLTRGFWEGWLAQSSWVIDALEMTGKEDKCFVVLPPSLKLRSIPRAGQYVGLAAFFKLCDSEPPPIYLFIHPAPTCLPELVSWLSGYQPTYFWSFDETGRTQMSDDDCEEWGLPQLYHTHHISSIQLRTWPDNVYKALRDWQIARGYDTATADFARHLGYPELEIIGPPKKTNAQSTEVQDEFVHTSDPDNVAKLTSSWWEAIAGSGISAFAL